MALTTLSPLTVITEDGRRAEIVTDDPRLAAYLHRVLDHVALWDRDAEHFVAPIPSEGTLKWYEPLRAGGGKGTVTVPRDVAVIINDCFLPTNPNKLRNAAPGVKEAAHAFRTAVGPRRA